MKMKQQQQHKHHPTLSHHHTATAAILFFSCQFCLVNAFASFQALAPISSLLHVRVQSNNAYTLFASSSYTTNNHNKNVNNNNKKATKRKKKNKYAKFSKTDQRKLDPLEELLLSSQEKNTHLHQKTTKSSFSSSSSTTAPHNETRDRNKRIFPSVQSIDPYDPSTYGYTELGTILGPHGVRGLVKLAAVTEFATQRLCTPGIRHLKSPNRRSPREIRLMEGRQRLKNEYLIQLEGVNDRNKAEKLRGYVLYARQEERPEDIEENEYLVTDLVGLEVRLVTGYGDQDVLEDEGEEETKKDQEVDNLSGKFVGIVGGIVLADEMCSIPGLGQDFLEVTLPRGTHGTPSFKDELVLIPMVPAIVSTVDLELGRVYIDPPRGLLDLTYIKEETVRIKGFLPETSSYEVMKKENDA